MHIFKRHLGFNSHNTLSSLAHCSYVIHSARLTLKDLDTSKS